MADEKEKMSCPSLDTIVIHHEDLLESEKKKQMEAHYAQCDYCTKRREQLQQLLSALAPAPDEFHDPDLVQDILNRVREQKSKKQITKPASRIPRWFLPATTSILAAAAAIVLFLWHPSLSHKESTVTSSPQQQFSSRSASREKTAPEQWLALWIFRRDARNQQYAEVQQLVYAHDRLAFGYLNLQGKYPYLMVLAINQTGRIFWYYPAYEKLGTNPTSIAIQAGRHELQEEIEQPLTQGRLQFIAIFSLRPLTISQVEKAIKYLWQKKAEKNMLLIKQLPFPDIKVLSREVDVVEAR